jgi:hypothetical protein
LDGLGCVVMGLEDTPNQHIGGNTQDGEHVLTLELAMYGRMTSTQQVNQCRFSTFKTRLQKSEVQKHNWRLTCTTSTTYH